MKDIYQVTIVYPNPTHNRTEVFDGPDDSRRFFDEIFEQRDEDKEYIAAYQFAIDTEKVQSRIIAYWKRAKS